MSTAEVIYISSDETDGEPSKVKNKEKAEDTYQHITDSKLQSKKNVGDIANTEINKTKVDKQPEPETDGTSKKQTNGGSSSIPLTLNKSKVNSRIFLIKIKISFVTNFMANRCYRKV